MVMICSFNMKKGAGRVACDLAPDCLFIILSQPFSISLSLHTNPILHQPRLTSHSTLGRIAFQLRTHSTPASPHAHMQVNNGTLLPTTRLLKQTEQRHKPLCTLSWTGSMLVLVACVSCIQIRKVRRGCIMVIG